MVEPLKGFPLSQPLQGWFERLRVAVSNAANKVSGMTVGNVFIAKSGGDLDDSGISINDLATEDYVDDAVIRIPAEYYLTEATVPEAGTEEGARHGSYRVGLLTENDYAYFDENGQLIFYGVAGVRVIVPVNATGGVTKFAVFDANGYLRYRTASEMMSDLSVDLGLYATKDYAAEHFITDAELPEAEVDGSPFVFDEVIADDMSFELPEIITGARGTVTIGAAGTIEASAEFEIDATGTVNLIHAVDAKIAANVASPGTDGKFNIGIGTTNPVKCRNRLGGPRRPLFRLWYN